MDWNLAGAVTLSGIVIVFLLLGILICTVWLMSSAINKAQEKTSPAAETKTASAQAVKASPQPTVQAGISGETVAVISAAVAAMQGGSGGGYNIASIKRARQPRPVWGFAGMQQNTRPF